MISESKNSKIKLILIWGLPLILGFLISLPTVFLGPDSETTMLYLYPFTFHQRTVDPFYYFTNILPTEVGDLPYRPFYCMHYTLDYMIFNNNVFWYRLENIFILLLVIWGAMRLAKKLSMGNWGIFITGMFLALHPAHEFMMISIFPRTDIGAALFILIIANLLLVKRPHVKFDGYLITAYLVFFLSTFWKESMFTVAIVILFVDLVAGWSKGRWFKRILLHLPFYIIGIFSIYLQVIMTGSLGYQVGWDEIWGLLIDLPSRGTPFFEPLWGIWAFPILKVLGDANTMLPAIIGLALTILLFLIGPNARCRLAILAMFILLGPYLLVWSGYMHIFVATLGLALWAGFFGEHFMMQRNKVRRFLPVLVFFPLLVMWGGIYISDFPKDYKYFQKKDKLVQYLVHRYPDPQPDTVFLLSNWEKSTDAKGARKRLGVINEYLQLTYHRKDISLYSADLPGSNVLDVSMVRQPVLIPGYISGDN